MCLPEGTERRHEKHKPFIQPRRSESNLEIPALEDYIVTLYTNHKSCLFLVLNDTLSYSLFTMCRIGKMLTYENDNRRKGSVCYRPWSSVKNPRKKQGHLPADGVPAGTNPRQNSIFLLLWYHECLPGRHNYLLGDFILFQTVRFRHNLSDRREERGRTVCSVLGAVVDSGWNVMSHGVAREGKGKENLANGVGSQYPPLPRDMVYPALLPLMRTPRLPVVDWTDALADLTL